MAEGATLEEENTWTDDVSPSASSYLEDSLIERLEALFPAETPSPFPNKTEGQVLRSGQHESVSSENTLEFATDSISWLSRSPSEPQTPFGEFDTREKEKRARLIKNVERLGIPHAERIFHRLSSLHSTTEEEYPYTELISVDSLSGFVKFLTEYQTMNFKYPDISITPSGNIHCQWPIDKAHYLSFETTSSQEAKIVLFAPDSKVLGKVSRWAASMSIVSIFTNLSNHNVESWVTV